MKSEAAGTLSIKKKAGSSVFVSFWILTLNAPVAMATHLYITL
jgi:hypothetical protein